MKDLEAKKKDFIDLYNANIKRDGASEFLEWLERTDFFVAPASTRYHGSHPGGLLEHSLNVFHEMLYLLNLPQQFGVTSKYTAETIAIVTLLPESSSGTGCSSTRSTRISRSDMARSQ